MVNSICCLSITPFEQQGINSIKRKLDLKNLIRVNDECELLKRFLLNKSQYDSINFIDKSYLITPDKVEDASWNSITRYYQSKHSSHSLSPIDQQLLSMFNPRKREEIVIPKKI